MKTLSVILILYIPTLTSCQNNNTNNDKIQIPLPPPIESRYAKILKQDSIEYENLKLTLENLMPINDSITRLFESFISKNINNDQLMCSEKYLFMVLNQYFNYNTATLMQFLFSRYNLQAYYTSQRTNDFMDKYPLLKYLALHYEADEIIRGIEFNKTFLEIDDSIDLDNFNLSIARTVGFALYSKISTDLYTEKRAKFYEYLDWEIKFYDGAKDASYVIFLKKVKVNLDQLYSF